MLPSDLAGRVEAPPGFLLVERVGEPSISRGGIIKPARYLASKLSSEARVVSVGAGMDVSRGTRVLLTSNLPRPIVFGWGVEKRELYCIRPAYVMALIHPDLASEVDSEGRDPMALYRPLTIDPEPRRDEGDPEGVR